MKRLVMNFGTIALLSAAFLQAGFKFAQPHNSRFLTSSGNLPSTYHAN